MKANGNRAVNGLQEVLAKSRSYDQDKADTVGPVHDLWFDTIGSKEELVMRFPPDIFGEMAPASLTNWAMQQVCDRLGPPPKRYIDQCPSWLQADNLNYWREQQEENTMWLARLYQGQVRAVLSNEYSVVDNSQVIDIMIHLLQEEGLDSNYRLTRPYVSPDALFLRVGMLEVMDGAYESGFFIGNGEIGNRSIQFAPYVKRNACDNSMIIMVEHGFTHVHRWRSAAWLRGTLKELAGNMLGYSTQVVEDIVRCEMEQVPNLRDVIDNIVREKGYNQVARDAILIGTEGERSRMALVNGISFAAQHTEDLSEEDRTDMEIFAGAILADPDDLFGAIGKKYAPVGAQSPVIQTEREIQLHGQRG